MTTPTSCAALSVRASFAPCRATSASCAKTTTSSSSARDDASATFLNAVATLFAHASRVERAAEEDERLRVLAVVRLDLRERDAVGRAPRRGDAVAAARRVGRRRRSARNSTAVGVFRLRRSLDRPALLSSSAAVVVVAPVDVVVVIEPPPPRAVREPRRVVRVVAHVRHRAVAKPPATSADPRDRGRGRRRRRARRRRARVARRSARPSDRVEQPRRRRRRRRAAARRGRRRLAGRLGVDAIRARRRLAGRLG
eukprot:29758-Pelagococcus_subviridis.AAC.1